jgi:hypothetical protein
MTPGDVVRVIVKLVTQGAETIYRTIKIVIQNITNDIAWVIQQANLIIAWWFRQSKLIDATIINIK